MLIGKYNLGTKYIDSLNIDHIESLYNYISDLMTLQMCTFERKERVNNEIQKLKIDINGVSRKRKIKYKLLRHKDWIVIYILAYVRKIYLQLK